MKLICFSISSFFSLSTILEFSVGNDMEFFGSSYTNLHTHGTVLVLKVLLPLVNVPMISYTLAWLESAGVEEVIVFCCAHSKQVISYLESSGWFSQPNFSVTTIESHNSVSAGDALRLIYERNVVCPHLNSQSFYLFVNYLFLNNVGLLVFAFRTSCFKE